MMQELLGAYAGKKILVTGHTGFKGSWMAFLLSQLGAKIYGFSLSEPEDKKHAYYALSIKSILANPDTAFGDVASCNWDDFLRDTSPDFIFNFAAQALVSESYLQPLRTILSNTFGSIALADAVRLLQHSVTCIFITSDKCYKNYERNYSYVETDELGGGDPYSASKAALEVLLQSYLLSYPDFCSSGGFATVRAGNVFGGGDWAFNRLIPDCARQIYSKEVLNIRMPEAIRPWSYVLDILCGYLILGSRLKTDPLKYRGSWNFASGETKTVLQIAESFLSVSQAGKIHIEEGASVGHEANLLLIDPNKSVTQLGWKPFSNVEESLTETAKWYMAQNQGNDMYSHSQAILKARGFL